MNLFVDDSREFPNYGYQCCRNAKAAECLLSVIKFESVSLDYSLGHGQETGLDILIWMKENNIFVKSINIHSNHVIGAERMKQYALENFPDSEVTTNTLPK